MFTERGYPPGKINAYLAPNHLTEHTRQIDAIFGDDVPNMSHMENQEEMKEA